LVECVGEITVFMYLLEELSMLFCPKDGGDKFLY